MLIYLQMIETEEDRSKFIAIYEAYSQKIYRIAYSRLRNPQDAEDAVHSVFVKIAENIKKVEPVCPKTRGLIVYISRNVITDMLRKKGRCRCIEFDDRLEHLAISKLQGGDLLSECILKLPGKERDVIWLKYCYGFSTKETAKLLHLTTGWVYKLNQKAKEDLNKLYTEGGGRI